MLSVQISEGREAIEAVADEWDLLVGDAYTAAFSQPCWYLAWLDAFRTAQPLVVTAREDGRLVGVLPLARIRTNAKGLFLTLIAPFARGDYQPPVVDPNAAPAALPAMLDAAFRRLGRRGVCWWPNIPVIDPALGIMRSFFTGRGMPFVEDHESAPRLRLHGASFEEIERGWTSSHRKDVRRQRKRLSERGPVTLWQPATLAEAEPVLGEFFRVHDEKWLLQGFPGMFRDPAQRGHFQAVLRRLWGRGVHFSTVRCGSEHVSFHFGFFAGGWLQWYRPSYRSSYADFSPGKVHMAMLVEEGCRWGWQGIDLLLGAEPYKNAWSNETLDVVSIHAGFHGWSPTYLWFTRGKPAARRRFLMTLMRAQAWLQKRRHQTS